MDIAKLKKDMDSPAITEELSKNRDLAQTLGIRGTPAFIVGNQLVPGAMNMQELRKLIRQARKENPVP